MSVSEQELKHLANLSSFEIPQDKAASLQQDIDQIVEYISQLDDIDTGNVEPTYQNFEMENVWREDEIKEQDADSEALLETAPDVQDNQIKVPKVL